MKDKGFILLARSIQQSDIWMNKSGDYLKVWLHILFRVNYEATKYLERGEGFFNLYDSSREIRVSRNTVYKCVAWLKLAKQITTRKAKDGLYIKVLKYKQYQDQDFYYGETVGETLGETKAKPKRNQSEIKAKPKRQPLLYIKKNKKNNITEGEKISNREKVELIGKYYKENIQEKAILTDLAIKKIEVRLKTNTVEELKLAIDRFAGNKWRMENNSDKGMSWFFDSDDKLAIFMALDQDNKKKKVIPTTNEKGERIAPNGSPLYQVTGII